MIDPKTLERGQEQHETFSPSGRRNRGKLVQYDYRSQSGELFSTVKPTLEECQKAKNAWLESTN